MGRAFSRAGRLVGRAALGGMTFALAALAAWLVFLLLPLLEQATRPQKGDLEFRSVGAADLPPPPPPPPTPEKEEESEEPPPPLIEPAAPLDLAQLELALNPTFGGAGDFVVRIPGMDGNSSATEETDAIFSAADLDQMPRATSQPPPEYPADLRRKRIGGTVYVVFIVDRTGRVVQPAIERTPHPQLGAAALAAVRKWRFEPGKRQGRPVPFKLRIPITFAN